MIKRDPGKTRLFVLDTNVLMHDPTAIYRFQEHDIYLPMVVLEELDRGKKGMSEVARNVRQVSRFLDGLMRDADKADIDAGLPIQPLRENMGGHVLPATGRIFFQTEQLEIELIGALPGSNPDNNILGVVQALQKRHPETTVILVSKDINLRIKAAVLGIPAEDYANDQVLEDVDLLYTGVVALEPGFWETHAKELDSWREEGHAFYRVRGPDVASWFPSQCLYMEGDEGFEAMVREKPTFDEAIIELVQDYRSQRHKVWGIMARNREQNFAFNMLLDPDLDFVTLLGTAGTGKTLLALAAGLAQVLDKPLYKEIIVTRVTIPVGEDIGFLPGTEEEKMTPWMGHHRIHHGLGSIKVDPRPQPPIMGQGQQVIDGGIAPRFIGQNFRGGTLASPETCGGCPLGIPLGLAVGGEIRAADVHELLETEIGVIAQDTGGVMPTLGRGDQCQLPWGRFELIPGAAEMPADGVRERVQTRVAGYRCLLCHDE